MRSFAAAAAALLMVLGGLEAAEPSSPEPWRWTESQRVQARFDPTSITERLANVRGTVRSKPTDAFLIDGQRNPELFFPWELMSFLLETMEVSGPAREVRQLTYSADIAAAGWDPKVLWETLEQESNEYVRIKATLEDQLKTSKGRHSDPFLRQELCDARAFALEASRQAFGREAFDKFLYTAVAPHYQMWTTHARSAEVLMRVERGCK